MRTHWIPIATVCLLLTQALFISYDPTIPQPAAPSIDVNCLLHKVFDNPNDPGLEATIKFGWRASNASYVLIQDRDQKRHPLTGVFESGGGAYTFIAVSSKGTARRTKMCFPQYKSGPGRYGLLWSIDYDPRASAFFDDAYEVTITTSLTKGEIENRLTELLSKEYSVSIEPQTYPMDDVVMFASNSGFHASLCDFDNCLRSRTKVERQVAFDMWGEKQSETNGKVTYKFHIVPSVTVRLSEPADAEWNSESDKSNILQPVARKLADRLIKLLE
ncbi:MAG: hypothetical protein H7Z16_17305 [Pyrinomonadaceae bacterium]|nr:hypothetical protein [Pyrinomonadaceae bacterium]